MKLPQKLSAFTLVELLVVLVLAGMMLLMVSGFTRRTQDTFISQQYIKTLLLNSRILRRKSMLITRSSAETSWVYGIGYKISKDTDNRWQLEQHKLLLAGDTNYYYRSYPEENTISIDNFIPIEDSSPQRLAKGLTLTISGESNNTNEKSCLERPVAFYVIFESINGKMHAYCSRDISSPLVPLGFVASGKPYQPNIKIGISYESGGFYQAKVNLLSNGEISSTR